MSENFPLVSVIIPTYNYAQFIEEAVKSVINQTYPLEKIEIVVIDDGSTDDTQNVLSQFKNVGNFKYIYQTNYGKANATCKGIEICNGKYIFSLDADDYFFSEKILSTVQIFERFPEVVHVSSSAFCVIQETLELTYENLPSKILENSIDGKEMLLYFYSRNILYGGGSSYAARASTLKSINIPEAVDMYIDEFLILSILNLGSSFFIEKPLSVWRIHSSNYSISNSSYREEIIKAERLLNSSSAVLNYLKNNFFDEHLIRMYILKDATRGISYKELLNDKSMIDIYHFAWKVYRLKLNWVIMRKYFVFNRLIPTFLFKFIKKVVK